MHVLLQVYTHHFVTFDTLMVPPPTGQGLMQRPPFPDQHHLLVPANLLQTEISRQAHHPHFAANCTSRVCAQFTPALMSIQACMPLLIAPWRISAEHIPYRAQDFVLSKAEQLQSM